MGNWIRSFPRLLALAAIVILPVWPALADVVAYRTRVTEELERPAAFRSALYGSLALGRLRAR